MSKNGRDKSGRFATGNPGGPGRPRRPVEQEYLSTLNEAVTLDDWKEIVQRAIVDAKKGDAKSREWLSARLMGDNPTSLLQLAADEQAGLTVEASIESLAARSRFSARMTTFQHLLAQMLNNNPVRTEQDVSSRLPTSVSHDATNVSPPRAID